MSVTPFSVLISLYHAEKSNHLNLCLTSLYEQKLRADEVVLVLDGEVSFELHQVINDWAELLNIKVFPLQHNVGLSKALNYGLSFCNYDLVARMDTDDISTYYRFEEQVKFMTLNENVDIVGTFSEDISESGKILGLRKVPISHDDILKNIWACPIIHPSVMFRKAKILEIGSYSETAPHRQDDYELWIRAANNNAVFANIPKTLIQYRIPDNAYKKNTVMVGINRARIGFKAVCKYDPRLLAFLGLLYPLIRAMLPQFLQVKLVAIASKLDPRS
ncbi:glycosyl transferase family 2 [Shewanella sp. Choline-02u-19]|uniref:glycosyltransferase n=1 Tax=unclassified Shewanella TaxID=196818 RepID=UPI000C34AF11|nr:MULTISPECIES: glycosyltransferase [unclassified Shewanella]PKH60649.1 glycosyl transferase family 2 [Shewanella sp. Bg11-22]PKI26922.1 glycosyl transferase family 2 [Shewanella sp. Choline-02u-19]